MSQDLSSQSSCNCGARVGQFHSSNCQYIADLNAHAAAQVVRTAEHIARTSGQR